MITQQNFKEASTSLREAHFPGIRGYITESGNLNFASCDGMDDTIIGGLSTEGDDYIKPNRDGSPHTLPQHAMLPILATDGTWNCPSDETVARAREIILATTGFGEILKPGWERLKRILNLHEDRNLSVDISNQDTDMGWTQRNFGKAYGGDENIGWYHGANFKTANEGFNNYHYDMLLILAVRFIFEEEESERQLLWPYLLKGLIAHSCYGRFWSGPNAGAARTEKGRDFVGGTGRPRHAKMFIANVIAGYLLVDQHPFFEAQLRMCMEWWTTNPEMGKDYGVRQAAANLQDSQLIGMAVPDLRVPAIEEMTRQLIMLDEHLDRYFWLWPNDGNNGEAPESPWMQGLTVAAILSCREHFPELRAFGPSDQDLNRVMQVIFSDYGSETVGDHRLVRYRYHTKMTGAGSVANTADCFRALRYLSGMGFDWAKEQYEETKGLLQTYCDCSLDRVRNRNPRDLGTVGYRDGENSGGWPKNMLMQLGALR